MKLLKTVTAAGTITLNEITPNRPIFVIHQAVEGTVALVGCRVKKDSTAYTLQANQETYHYFGMARSYHTNQVMMFVPSTNSITFEFPTDNPPTANSRLLIFQ